MIWCLFFYSSRRRHTRCALVTGVQTCALPISADNLPVAVLVPKAWNDRVEPVPARFVGRIGKIIEQVRACDGRDRNAGRIDHAADEAACLRRHTAARLKDALENVPL